MQEKKQREKAKIHDDKAAQLRQEMEEFNKKYPASQRADRESVVWLIDIVLYLTMLSLNIIQLPHIALLSSSRNIIQFLSKYIINSNSSL